MARVSKEHEERKNEILDTARRLFYINSYNNTSVNAIIEAVGISKGTFYHYFNLQPRGEYVISVCLGTACYVKGSERILGALKNELKVDVGETTEDMKFTLLTTRCLGTCALSPVMMINGKVYSQVTTKKVASIIHKLRAIDLKG